VIGTYLKQSATIKRRTGVTSSGTPLFTTIPIKCLFEWGAKLVVDGTGQVVTAAGHLFTVTPVHVGDLVVHEGRDWTVIAAYARIGLSGKVDHYEVFI